MNPDNKSVQLELQNVCKSFVARNKKTETLDVLANISFSVTRGEIVCILGPSGCGKTTLLKIVDGLIQPDAGQVMINGIVVQGPDYDRAFIFQEINLLPWRTALSNISLGLEFKGIEKEKAESEAMVYLEIVGLKKFKDYYPHQLSGGMKQRIGIARALAVEPEILLCDEPFGSLDALTQETLQVELLRIIQQTKKTAVFVTHNIDEAIFLGDKVIVLSSRPGTIKRELAIDIERPRVLPDAKLTSRFSEYKKSLWETVTSDQNHEIQ